MERIRLGNNIAISWALYDLNGRVHSLEDKEVQLYVSCGGLKQAVTDYTIQGNVVSWVFLGTEQKKVGLYKLILVETDALSGAQVVDVAEAFRLVSETLSAVETGEVTKNVSVRSVLTYSNLVGVESVDVVESSEDGGTNLVSIHLVDGNVVEIPIKNGSKGDTGATGATGATGPKGDKGDIGERGPVGIDSVEASIGTNDPTQAPSVDKELAEGVLSLTFNNIKGQKGDKGDQGNTGSSVDYPYELVNNVTTDDATKGLSAAQGVVLDGKIGQLGQYTDSPEFIRVITDGEDKILEGITEEGRKIINIPIGTPAIDVNHSQSKEYVSAVLDKDGRVVSGRDTNGRLIEFVGVTTPMTETDALNVNYEVILSEKAAYSLRVSIDNQISTDRKKQEYSALFKDAGNSVESFLFYTDPHYFESNDSCELSGESKEYIKRMKNYFENTPTDFVINGGDWLNTHQKVIGIEDLGWVDGMMRGLFGNNYYPVFGNHESNPYSGGNNIPIEVVKNLWFRKWGKMYYSFLANNSRFYVLDSGSDGTVEMDSYRWEEVDWFANELLNGDDANIVMVIHIGDLNYTNPFLFGQNTPPITDNLTKIAEAYNSRNEITLNGVTYNFTTASGTIHCLLCGHSHYDANAVINSIPAICFDDAMTGNFTLVLLDFDNRKLKSIRVGTGDNREITIL